jgi:hypothetical protein
MDRRNKINSVMAGLRKGRIQYGFNEKRKEVVNNTSEKRKIKIVW